MILSETIGNYSQTIRIGRKNEVEVRVDGKGVFDGEATHIIDTGDRLSFKDKNGNLHEFVKYLICTYS